MTRTRARKSPNIAAKLAACMDGQRMTPVEVAFYLNVSESTVYRWLDGETVPVRATRNRLANLFNVEVQDLYEETA